jgi:hypothetical protein
MYSKTIPPPRATREKETDPLFGPHLFENVPILKGLLHSKGEITRRVISFSPMLANISYAAFFCVLESKGWRRIFQPGNPSGAKLQKTYALESLFWSRRSSSLTGIEGAQPPQGIGWKQIEPAIVDSIVKRRCGRMFDVGGKAEDIYSWLVFRCAAAAAVNMMRPPRVACTFSKPTIGSRPALTDYLGFSVVP